jgi:hypothetical protein
MDKNINIIQKNTEPLLYSSKKVGLKAVTEKISSLVTRLRLHSEELHNLYSSSDIIRQIKSRRMRYMGHVAHMGE